MAMEIWFEHQYTVLYISKSVWRITPKIIIKVISFEIYFLFRHLLFSKLNLNFSKLNHKMFQTHSTKKYLNFDDIIQNIYSTVCIENKRYAMK